MFILTIHGKETEGAYSVTDESSGDKILYLFEEEDDATRFAMMLEDDGYPEMHILEIDGDDMIQACILHGHRYTVITANDVVIPPNIEHDFI